MLRPATISLCYLLSSFSTLAAPYPVPMTVNTVIDSPTTLTYYVTWGLKDIKGTEKIAPRYYTHGPAHRHWINATNDTVLFDGVAHYALGELSYSALAVEQYNKGSLPGSIGHRGYNGPECIGYAFSSETGTKPWSTVVQFPGFCLAVPPAGQWCALVTPELTFDHGTLTLAESSGHRVSKKLTIDCTAGTRVKLSLADGDHWTIPIGGGLAKFTTIYGMLGRATIDLPSGRKEINVTSELQNVKAGEWRASGVLIIEPA